MFDDHKIIDLHRDVVVGGYAVVGSGMFPSMCVHACTCTVGGLDRWLYRFPSRPSRSGDGAVFMFRQCLLLLSLMLQRISTCHAFLFVPCVTAHISACMLCCQHMKTQGTRRSNYLPTGVDRPHTICTHKLASCACMLMYMYKHLLYTFAFHPS